MHVPYEGATGEDLFIEPDWHGFHWKVLGKGQDLSSAFADKKCRYILSEKNYLNLGSAIRTQVGDWVRYKDNASTECFPNCVPFSRMDVFSKDLEFALSLALSLSC